MVDLGAIARESALIAEVTALNVSRGYTSATVSASQPWLEIYPAQLNLWAGIPADIPVGETSTPRTCPSVRAARRDHIKAEGQESIEVPVTGAVVADPRDVAPDVAGPGGGLSREPAHMRAAWHTVSRVRQAIATPFARHGWLFWLAWFALGLALGVGLPRYVDLSPYNGMVVALGDPVLDGLANRTLLAVVGPPFLLSSVWIAFLLVMLVGGASSGRCAAPGSRSTSSAVPDW